MKGMALPECIKVWRIECALLVTGFALVAAAGLARLDGATSARSAVTEFQFHQTGQPSDGALVPGESVTRADAPIAIFRVERIHLEAPVFDGVDAVTLNKGLGRIPGTAKPGWVGNLGIAGHRDSFFRDLKDIRSGDTIELQLPKQTERYVVDKILIVRPEQTDVLAPTETPTLTLVTCFPFSFIGHAPERYIVSASIRNSISTE